MLDAEVYLLETVRDALRLGIPLKSFECDVEYDADFVPQTAGNLYVSVSPDGFGLGKNHNSSGGVYDFVYGCRVTVYLRSTDTPRDMRRSLFLEQVRGLNAILDAVIRTLDWKTAITNAASLRLKDDNPTANGFNHPLTLTSVDAKPRTVVGEVYGANVKSAMGADTYVGLARGASFGKARRTEVQP